jgi:cellulose synthase (UDP-forming)
MNLQALCRASGANLPHPRTQRACQGRQPQQRLANSTGDLVVVFDADHAPARDFLT